MLSLIKKLRNWLVMGKFISIYIVTYKCDKVIDTFIIESESKLEAIKRAYEEGSKMNCKTFELLDIIEH